MDDHKYLEIILLGIQKHRRYLAEYFKREQLKAEEQYVGIDEFKYRLLDLVRCINLESRFWKCLIDITSRSMSPDEAMHPEEQEKLHYLRNKNTLLSTVNRNRSWSEGEVEDMMDSTKVMVDALIKAFGFSLDKEAVDLPEINENNKDPQHLFLKETTSKSFEAVERSLHDPNLWNLRCYKLFNYLFKNYYRGKKRELTNIWFYLKEFDPQNYTLIATKDRYKEFIKNHCGQVLKNFDKASIKFEEKDRPIMDAHRIEFENYRP